MPRPTKLTPEVQTRIVEAIQRTATYELAAMYGGISYNTFNEWMKAGERARSGVKREFYEAVKQAEGEAAIKLLAKIDLAATDNWQAAAWKLERRYPHMYGRQVQTIEVDWRREMMDAGIDPSEALEALTQTIAAKLRSAAAGGDEGSQEAD